MYVKNYMSTDLVTITPDTTVIKALDLMRQHDIHRLPVVVKGQLVGLLTESVIAKNSPSTATSLSVHELNYLLNKTTAADIMIRRVITTSPDALLEQAASEMRNMDVGVLVVMDHAQLVGIITDKDIFEAFIDINGYYTSGTRFVVEVVDDKAGILEDIGETTAKHNWSITQMNVYHLDDKTNVVVHVDTQDSEEVARVFQEKGYKVSGVFVKPE
ncbi:CBS domain-containing protein [uncultured Abiotrophia sp.]|uniref:CBS domain-containing protein n=1 Tax=uncultured Abiotrophia sp. TaxID=316094 RepID=UPI0028DB4BC2|nr:CBS domain-containing protein [uncultured Abiotrophia sp.]